MRDCVLFSGKYKLYADADEIEELVVDLPKTSADIPKRIFPKLKTVRWHHRNTHTKKHFFRLLEFNPHLKTLHILADVGTRLSVEDFTKIACLVKGIEELFIESIDDLSGMISLAGFQCLKRLEIRNQFKTFGFVRQIANTLFEQDIQIEHLAMIGVVITRNDFESILKLRTLRHAHFDMIIEFNDNDLVSLAKHLKLLHTLTIKQKYYQVSYNSLAGLVRFAGNLTVFKLNYYHHSFDRQSYEVLVDVIRKRKNGPLKLVIGWGNRRYPDLTSEIVKNNKTVCQEFHSGFCLTIRKDP